MDYQRDPELCFRQLSDRVLLSNTTDFNTLETTYLILLRGKIFERKMLDVYEKIMIYEWSSALRGAKGRGKV
jgi:hypothetical protein